jgi:hypothetical protein
VEVMEFLAKSEPKIMEVDEVVKKELSLVTLIGQREKMSRDEITAMILSGEEGLRMLIRNPSS